MWHYVRNHLKHNITWFYCNRFLRRMIAYYEHQCTNHFLSIAEINYNNILFHKSFQCAIMSEITLNITLHGSNCSRLLGHFIP